jgi:thiol-disulfide isomerase/thioredoxin
MTLDLNMFKKNSTIIFFVVVALLLIIFLGFYYYKYVMSVKKTLYLDESFASKQAEFMLFYVDWCPHCKTAKPEWEKIKQEYDGKTMKGYTLLFKEYNCTNENAEIEQLIEKYKIDGYPTIKLLKDNQVIDFDAKPSQSSLTQFINEAL